MDKVTHIGQLKHDQRNPRKHNPRNVGMVVNSLQQVGFARSIVIDEDNTILAGNGVTEAATLAGMEKVIEVEADGNTIVAVRRTGLTDEQKQKLKYFDNRSSDLAEWDLSVIVSDLDTDIDLSDLWTPDEWAGLLEAAGSEMMGNGAGAKDAEPQINRAAELQAVWGTELGQVWEFPSKVAGQVHRLAIGDCTDKATVEAVMRGEGADACITDPPYGMNWNADASRFSGGKFGGHPRGREREDVINDDKPFDPRPFLNFPVVVLWGMNHFCDKLPSGGVLVWIKKPDERFGTFLSDCELAWTNIGVGVYAFRHEWGGITRESERGEFLHPTQKPVALISWTIEKSKAGIVIYDPFTGSGTTLIAAHNLNRVARCIEIDPGYVAVSLQRYLDATGNHPERVSG